jgi:hypothetical protein
MYQQLAIAGGQLLEVHKQDDLKHEPFRCYEHSNTQQQP